MASKGNPSVTITQGRIASLRRDDRGQLSLIQLDGPIMPGDGGGPIVEEELARLSAGCRRGTCDGLFDRSASGQIGVGRTNRILDSLRRSPPRGLAGRIGALSVSLESVRQGTLDLQVKAQVVDPKGTVKAVLVRMAPTTAGGIVPDADGTWPALPGTKEVELEHDRVTSSASGKVQVVPDGRPQRSSPGYAHRYKSGPPVYSKPREIELPEHPGQILLSNDMRRLLMAREHDSLAMLGPLIDPDKDCKLVKDAVDMKITIEVPGKLHTLSPAISSRLEKKKPLHNAPFTVTEVDSDFAAVVEVSGEILPGPTLPKDRRGNDFAFTFQSAGLLLYRDRDNFIRLSEPWECRSMRSNQSTRSCSKS